MNFCATCYPYLSLLFPEVNSSTRSTSSHGSSPVHSNDNQLPAAISFFLFNKIFADQPPISVKNELLSEKLTLTYRCIWWQWQSAYGEPFPSEDFTSSNLYARNCLEQLLNALPFIKYKIYKHPKQSEIVHNQVATVQTQDYECTIPSPLYFLAALQNDETRQPLELFCQKFVNELVLPLVKRYSSQLIMPTDVDQFWIEHD